MYNDYKLIFLRVVVFEVEQPVEVLAVAMVTAEFMRFCSHYLFELPKAIGVRFRD